MLLFGPMITKRREARLSILEFLDNMNRGHTAYFWLRNGLPIIERYLRRFGLAVKKKGDLYRWATYSMYRGNSQIEGELRSIGDWVLRDPPQADIVRLNSDVAVQARAAERTEYHPPKTFADIPSWIAAGALSRIWRRHDKLYNAFVIAILGSIIFLALGETPLPFPSWYVQGASLALLVFALSIGGALARRKPPAKVRNLITAIYSATLDPDDDYGIDSLTGFVKTMLRERTTIQALGPVFLRVSPKVHTKVSEVLQMIETNTPSGPNVPESAIASNLLRDPRTRVLVSDLRTECADASSDSAYSDDAP